MPSPEEVRVRGLLNDTVGLLCRNGLTYSDTLRVEGLIGITLDNNRVFLVHINETYPGAGVNSITPESDLKTSKQEDTRKSSKSSIKVISKHESSSSSGSFKESSKQSSTTYASPSIKIKEEIYEDYDDDDDLMIITKQEPGTQPSDRVPPLHDASSMHLPNLQSTMSPTFSGSRKSNSERRGDNSERRGEPPAKRHSGSQRFGSFHTDSGGGFDSSDWPGSGSNQTLALPTHDDSTSSMDSQGAPLSGAGWQPGPVGSLSPAVMGGLGAGPGAGPDWEQMASNPDAAAQMMALLSSKRRTDVENKKFVCHYEGCDKRYFNSTDLNRHQRATHGASRKRPGRKPAPGGLYSLTDMELEQINEDNSWPSPDTAVQHTQAASQDSTSQNTTQHISGIVDDSTEPWQCN